MADFQRQKFEAITLADWRALDPTGNKQGPTRPVTDAAIGDHGAHWTDWRHRR
jgi:hypothetical protein